MMIATWTTIRNTDSPPLPTSWTHVIQLLDLMAYILIDASNGGERRIIQILGINNTIERSSNLPMRALPNMNSITKS
jgi:hypothetical protein